MPSLLGLMPQAVSQPGHVAIYAQVTDPLPVSATDPLFLVVPDWTTDFSYEFPTWPRLYGTTLPALGAGAVIIVDSRGDRRCVWWEGVYGPVTRGTLGIARGTASISFSASTTSTTATVTHGLGSTPTSIVATISGTPQVVVVSSSAAGSTTFQLSGVSASSITATIALDWVAVL